MSAATVTAPARTPVGTLSTPARPAAAAPGAADRSRRPLRAVPGATRPRLLLPPLTERPAARSATDVALAVPPRLRSLRTAVVEEAWPHDPRRTVTTAPLPDPDDVCGPLVLTAVEALQGGRPLAQLVRWVSPELYERLTAAAAAPDGSARRRITVLRTLVCRVDERTAEGTVVVHDGTRVRAAAVRLEAHRGRWRATVLEIG
ncbi:Rv3235 family protein [Actinotalea sp. AC32]|nr:Rv3235 family protein [Actinotalea sp. AC32]